jgi:hypothetical protein
MWVYPTFTEIDPDGQSYLARTTSAGTGSAYSHQIGTIFSGGSKFISHTFDGATRTVIGTTPANEGAIYHVAGTAKNGDVVRLYVNGKEEGTPLSVGTLWTGGDRWWIASVRATGHWYQGLMWDVRLYDRVLSAPEIYALYDPATREDLYTVPQRLLASTGITIVPVSQDFSPVYEALHGTISSDQLMSFEATQFLAQSRVIPYEAASGTVSGERDVSFEAQGFSTRSEASPYEALGGVTEVARTHTLSYEALAAAIARTYVIPWEAREVQVALTAPLGITAATVWTGGARDAHAWTGGASQARSWSGGAQTAIGGV